MAEQSRRPREPRAPVKEATAAAAESQELQEVSVGKIERPTAEEPRTAEAASLTNAAAAESQELQEVRVGKIERPTVEEPRTVEAALAPTLVNAQIEFATLDDDKDQKTLVTVTVVDFERVVAARVSARFGQFVDHTESGLINLRVLNASAKTSLQRGAVTIRIDPEGDDTWKFNFFLLLTFSDGSTLQAEASQIGLSDAGGDFSPELTVGIGGLMP
jgi:hypothetical protein